LLLRHYPQDEARIQALVQDYRAGALSPAQIQQILIANDSWNKVSAAVRAALK
jgi:hypothetical protein